MENDSDDIVSLPSPPPPRPAPRREAIDTALRKFDGIEEPPAARPARQRHALFQWAAMNRRPAGALVAATIIAVVGIPAVQIALRDRPPEVATEAVAPAAELPVQDNIGEGMTPSEPPQARSDEAAIEAAKPSPAQAAMPPATVTEGRARLVSAESDRKATAAPPATVMAAPAPPPIVAAPPPPPPPPPAEPEAERGQNIVVTGSLVRNPNLAKEQGYAQRAEDSAGLLVPINPYAEFLSRLQAGLRANDRRVVVRLVALPLNVTLNGENRTYRSSREVERDFDRIFTAEVRQAALTLRPDTLMSRDGGRLMGKGGLWFGCARKPCATAGEVGIREIRP